MHKLGNWLITITWRCCYMLTLQPVVTVALPGLDKHRPVSCVS